MNSNIAIAVIAACFCGVAMFVYLAGELRGLLAWHVLPSSYFGVPKTLAERGMTVLYEVPGYYGWDGQFYYGIANDLRMGAETIQHIDAPTYRYQRIGLALAANAVALVSLHSWVTPFVYWGTNVLLVAVGTFAMASILRTLQLPALFALFWSLSAGVQVTVLNGLPDAAADAFFLVALACLTRRHMLAYAFAITMAILSRESYAVAAAGLFVLELVRLWADRVTTFRALARTLVMMSLPGITLIAWQLFIYSHFGRFPSQEFGVAGQLVNFPFVGWWTTASGILAGNHLLSAANVLLPDRWLALLHGALLVLAIVASLVLLRPRGSSPLQTEIGAALLPFSVLCTTLGPGVIAHWSGYLKATAILVLPLLATMSRRSRVFTSVGIALLSFYLFLQQEALWNRIQPDGPASANQFASTQAVLRKPAMDFPEKLACLSDYRSNLVLRGIENFDRRPIFRLLLGRPMRYRIDVDVTNVTSQPWKYAQGAGSVALIGRWVEPGTNKELGRSRRAIIGNDLKPGETRRLSLVVDIPPYSKSSDFVVTMIQDGCAWFSDAGDQGAIRLPLR